MSTWIGKCSTYFELNSIITRRTMACCLIASGSIFFGVSVKGALSHLPVVGFIPDQRVASAPFVKQYFQIVDSDTLSGVTFTVASSDPIFLPVINAWYISVGSCQGGGTGCNGGYKVSFPHPPPLSQGVTTITITATDNSGLKGYTSFTLQLDLSGKRNPPNLGALPNRVMQLPPSGPATYYTTFVVGDLNATGTEDVCDIVIGRDFTVTSGNASVLLNSDIDLELMPPDPRFAITQGCRSYLLTATARQIGVSTVTLTLHDPNDYALTTSTSFVLQVGANADAQPSFAAGQATYIVVPVPVPIPTPTPYQFTVLSNDGTLVQDLRVTAKSSNTILVPNDASHLSCGTPAPTTGIGSVSITPVLPLPGPSPGIPQASTITLSVTDGQYTTQSTFLYIAEPSGIAANSFCRPTGVYSLIPDEFHHRANDTFLTGEVTAVSWAQVELDSANPNWTAVTDAIDKVPRAQDVSLNFQEDPCDIANKPVYGPGGQDCLEYPTWCDGPDQASALRVINCHPMNQCGSDGTGTSRAVPWDHYLRARRDNFIQQLPANLGTDSFGVKRITRISTINTNLPGGIRASGMLLWNSMTCWVTAG